MKVLFILFLIFIISLNNIDGFMNYRSYVNYDNQDNLILCPKNYSKMNKDLLMYKKTLQPYGYTKNEFLDKTRFVQTEIPLPTNPDFFYK